MPLIEATVSCPVHASFRVQQVAGMFDVPLAERASETFRVEVPGIGDDWKVGAIVGPSGSGKTTVAKQAFGEIWTRQKWRDDHAMIDGVMHPVGGTRAICEAFISVGLSSPPSWIKPYWALSNGQQFRCELAAALLCGLRLIVFDEFTSFVDRTVAKVGSLAVQRAIRSDKFAKKFVAVTCHYDVLDWLEPDWVLDMASGQLARGSLWRRPPITLEIARCHHRAWSLFAPHHYLSRTLNPSARCYLATWHDEPVAFAGLLANFGRNNDGWRVSRIVVLPDYQGVGIGGQFLDSVAMLVNCRDIPPPSFVDPPDAYFEKVTIVASHPAIIRHCERSPRWRCHAFTPGGKPVRACDDRGRTGGQSPAPSRSVGRSTASFTWAG